MEIKVQRDTKLMLAFTEEEAIQLNSLFLAVPSGTLPLADELYRALKDHDITHDNALIDKIADAFVETYEGTPGGEE